MYCVSGFTYLFAQYTILQKALQMLTIVYCRLFLELRGSLQSEFTMQEFKYHDMYFQLFLELHTYIDHFKRNLQCKNDIP